MEYLEKRFSYTAAAELNLYYCGKRVKTKNHKYGPQVRDHFLLVYIKEGSGTLINGNDYMNLSSGQLLCMFPGEKIYYTTEKDSHWSILWVGVYGTKTGFYINSLGITRQNPVYDCPNPDETEAAIEEIIETADKNNAYGKLKTISKLYDFFSSLNDKNSEKYISAVPPTDIHGTDTHEIVYLSDNVYIREAENYIRFNYDRDISVGSLADSLNLSSEYFSRLFKAETGMSPQNMIIEYRIKKACSLLKSTNFTVTEIANCVGIQDQHYFSKLFKNYLGCTPSEYRKA